MYSFHHLRSPSPCPHTNHPLQPTSFSLYIRTHRHTLSPWLLHHSLGSGDFAACQDVEKVTDLTGSGVPKPTHPLLEQFPLHATLPSALPRNLQGHVQISNPFLPPTLPPPPSSHTPKSSQAPPLSQGMLAATGQGYWEDVLAVAAASGARAAHAAPFPGSSGSAVA